MVGKKYLILGGAGFLGSHMVRECASSGGSSDVRIFDNFSSGRLWHLENLEDKPNVEVVQGDIKDFEALSSCMKGVDVVYHFAANPDIAAAIEKPDIDFWEGTYLVHNTLEAMRINGARTLLYASGSGVFGDTGSLEVSEDYAPMRPISTYGASKLACEALICSYCHMFGLSAAAFRFANVVGAKQTHGVVYDFIRRLLANPRELFILGDGEQRKAYIHVMDAVSAMRTIERSSMSGFSVFNVAPRGELSVKEIADIVVEVMGPEGVEYTFAGGARGWKGDVPIVRLNSEAIRSKGWRSKLSSREAVHLAVHSILAAQDKHGFSGTV